MLAHIFSIIRSLISSSNLLFQSNYSRRDDAETTRLPIGSLSHSAITYSDNSHQFGAKNATKSAQNKHSDNWGKGATLAGKTIYNLWPMAAATKRALSRVIIKGFRRVDDADVKNDDK